MNDAALIALGRIAAIERAVAALISTHPAPETLSAFWTEVSPAWRETLQKEHSETPLFLQAAAESLDRFERTVLRVAGASAQSAAPSHRQ
jgi:hypothetical protein